MGYINKKDINEVYSVSCVESYILAFLKKKGVNISYLYCNGFVSVDHLICDFSCNDITYADYRNVERIQDVAKEMGILDLKGAKNSSLDFINNESNEYLLEIKDEQFRKLYGHGAWRDDHYVYIKKKSEKEYFYLNDNPRHEMVIDSNYLFELYNQRYISFRYLGKNMDRDLAFYRSLMQYEKESAYTEYRIDILKYEVLRDIICMLRVSRKRVSDFIGEWEVPNNMWVERINNIFSKVEYSRVRKRYSSAIFFDELDNLRKDELEIGAYLYRIKERLQ